MIPVYIAGRNYRRFPVINAEQRLFPRGKVVAIVGRNGTGKTTVLRFITECLYGVDDKEDLRFRGASTSDPVHMLMVFWQNGQLYRVERKYTGANLSPSATLQLCNRPVTPDDDLLAVIHDDDAWSSQTMQSAQAVTRAIEELIGMNQKEFERTVFSPQGETGNFLEATPREKEDFIARATGIEELKRVEQRLNQDANQLEARIEGMEMLQQDTAALQARIAEIAGEIAAAEAQAVRAEAEVQQAAAVLRTVQQEFAAMREAHERDQALGTEITRRQAELTAGERDLARLRQEQATLAEERQWLLANQGVLARCDALAQEDSRLSDDRLRAQSRRALEEQLAAIAAREAQRAAEEERDARVLAELERLPELMAQLGAERAEREKQRSALAALIARLDSQREQREADIARLTGEMQAVQQLADGACCPTCQQGVSQEQREAVIRRYQDWIAEQQQAQSAVEQELARRRQQAQNLEVYYQRLLQKERTLEQQRLRRERLVEAASRRMQERDRDEVERRRLEGELARVGDATYDEARHRAVRAELAQLQAVRDRILTVQDRVNRRSEPVREEIARTEQHIAALRAEIERLTAERAALGFDREAYDRKHQEVEQAHARHLSATAARHDARARCDRLRLEQSQVEDQIRQQERRAEEIAAARQDLVDLRQLHGHVRECRRELLAEIVPELSRLMSARIAEMTRGRYTVCRMDASYNLFIYDGAHLVNVKKSFSGGEQLVASLAFRLALNAFLSRRTAGDRRRALFLDEVLAPLDSDRKDAVVEMLRQVQDIETIYLIHHDNELAERCDAAIRVEDIPGGGSRIVWDSDASAA